MAIKKSELYSSLWASCDELDRISQALPQRVKELAERYEVPLPTLTGKVAELSAKVAAHLKKLGFQP